VRHREVVSFNGGTTQSFASDPTGPNIGQWDYYGPHTSSYTDPTRPGDGLTSYNGFDDFGWKTTGYATGEPNEIGGLLWRPDTNVTNAGASFYADTVGPLSLDQPLHAEGYVSQTYANSDSDTLFGWFNPATINVSGLQHNFVGFAVGGDSSVGYPVRGIVRAAAPDPGQKISSGDTTAPRLDPDASRHHFSIDYVPNPDGTGTLTVTVDGQPSILQVTAQQRADGATLTRFGICQSSSGNGPSQVIYYDSLAYTAT
jgi:hypothetical protein